jgi:transposase
VLKKGEVKMIKKFLKEGMSKSEVARRLGISRNTVARYANKPDGYIPIIEKESKDTTVDPYLPHIKNMLQTAKDQGSHIPTTVILEDIKKLGYTGSLRWLQQVMQKHELRDRILKEELVRFETEPGKQFQVDWIEFPKDNLSAFVATMGHSRVSYVQYVSDEKIETLIECHLNAFKYFGGVPEHGLYDNMKTVIIKRNAYGYGKHKLNPMFEDFAKHCGFKIKVCKPYTPKTKGKVERFNHYLRYSFHNALTVRLAMKNYELNIDNANSEVLKWLDNVANVRIHSTTLQKPLKLLKEEIPYLKAIPKPYNGIHPKNSDNIIIKDNKIIRTNIPIGVISIPQRDLQSYDTLIPTAIFLAPIIVYSKNYEMINSIGTSLWN